MAFIVENDRASSTRHRLSESLFIQTRRLYRNEYMRDLQKLTNLLALCKMTVLAILTH